MSDTSNYSASAGHADVLIAGGAVIGSSVAAHIAADPGFSGRVVVVEKDPTYQFSASALSAASIRQQFASPVNIAISLYGIAFLREIGERLAVGDDRPQIDLREGGYLYVASEAGAKVLREVQAIQNGMGADIVYMEADALKARFPWLDTDGIAERLVGGAARLVRRVGPDAGLPQEGAQPRRHLYRRGGRGSGARGRPGRRREAGRRQPYRVRCAGRCGGCVRRTQAGGDGWRAGSL